MEKPDKVMIYYYFLVTGYIKAIKKQMKTDIS